MSQIKSKSTLSKSFKALGKQCRITAENIADNGEDLLQLAINELHRIEEKFCKYKNDSLITKINRRAGLNHPALIQIYIIVHALSLCWCTDCGLRTCTGVPEDVVKLAFQQLEVGKWLDHFLWLAKG